MLFRNTNGWFVLYLTCKRKCKKIRLVYQVSSIKCHFTQYNNNSQKYKLPPYTLSNHQEFNQQIKVERTY